MSFSVRYTRQAAQDLSAAAERVQTAEGEAAAMRFVDAVARVTGSLEGSPTLGTPCDIHSMRSRSLKRLVLPAPFAAWKIYYAVLFSELRVERVLHMAPQAQEAVQRVDETSADR